MSRLREFSMPARASVWPSAGDLARAERRSTLYSPDGSILVTETAEGMALQARVLTYSGPWACAIGSDRQSIEVLYDGTGTAWSNLPTYAAAQYGSGAFRFDNLIGYTTERVVAIPTAIGEYAVCVDIRWDGATLSHAAPYPLAELVAYEYAAWDSMSVAGAATSFYGTEATVPATVVGRQMIPLGVAYCDGTRVTAWHQIQHGPVILRPPRRWTYAQSGGAGPLTYYTIRNDTLELAAYSKAFAAHPVAGATIYLHYLGVSPWWSLETSGTPGGSDRLLGTLTTNAAGRLEYILDYAEVGAP